MSEWISVEERLPEKKQDVLMAFETGNMAVGWWHDADEHITFWCAYTDDGFYTDCDCSQLTGCPSQKARRMDADTNGEAKKYTAEEIKELAKKAFEA